MVSVRVPFLKPFDFIAKQVLEGISDYPLIPIRVHPDSFLERLSATSLYHSFGAHSERNNLSAYAPGVHNGRVGSFWLLFGSAIAGAVELRRALHLSNELEVTNDVVLLYVNERH
jgi:hypothetical protein